MTQDAQIKKSSHFVAHSSLDFHLLNIKKLSKRLQKVQNASAEPLQFWPLPVNYKLITFYIATELKLVCHFATTHARNAPIRMQLIKWDFSCRYAEDSHDSCYLHQDKTEIAISYTCAWRPNFANTNFKPNEFLIILCEFCLLFKVILKIVFLTRISLIILKKLGRELNVFFSCRFSFDFVILKSLLAPFSASLLTNSCSFPQRWTDVGKNTSDGFF